MLTALLSNFIYNRRGGSYFFRAFLPILREPTSSQRDANLPVYLLHLHILWHQALTLGKVCRVAGGRDNGYENHLAPAVQRMSVCHSHQTHCRRYLPKYGCATYCRATATSSVAIRAEARQTQRGQAQVDDTAGASRTALDAHGSFPWL